jgi:cell division ATPase FtsA
MAIGVDLGNWQSVVVHSSLEAETVSCQVATNALANRATPTAVAFTDKQRLFGEEAEELCRTRPNDCITHLLDGFGTEAAVRSLADLGEWGWKYSDGKIGPVAFGDRDVSLTPSHLLASYLEKLATFAEAPANAPLSVAIPENFTAEARAQVDGALRLLERPAEVVLQSEAIAQAYIYKDSAALAEAARNVMFVDVGYERTTVTVASFSTVDGKVEAKTVAECKNVGTRMMLRELFSYCAERIEKKHDRAVTPTSKPGLRLRTALAKALKELSMLPQTDLNLECFFPADDIDVKLDLTRAILEDRIKPQLQELTALVSSVLKKAEKEWADIAVVEAVGGGARIPCVAETLRSVLPEGLGLGAGLDGSSCIATGACYGLAVRLRGGSSVAKVARTEEDGPSVELERWIQEVDGEETARLAKMNELESYLYQVRDWTQGKDKALLKPAEAKLDEWILWNEDSQFAEVPTTLKQYTDKLAEVQDFLRTECAAFFEQQQKKKEDDEAKLAEASEAEKKRRQELGMDFDKDERAMPKSERFRLAGKQKEEGNELFKAGKHDDAIRRWKKACDHLTRPEVKENMTPEEKEQATQIMTTCHVNTAQSYITAAKKQEVDAGKNEASVFYKKAMNSLDTALEMSDTVKARFRRSVCHEKLGDLAKAMDDINAGLKLEPENADLKKAQVRIEKLQEAEKAKAKKMYGKMFG